MKQGVSVPDLDDGEFFLIRLLRNGKMQSLGDCSKFRIIVEQLTCHYCLRDQGIEKSRQISINSAAAHYACV